MLKGWLVTGACLIRLFALGLHAQSVEFLPEINVHAKLDSNMRFVFQAKETRENGIPKQAEIGPSMEFYWRPLKNLLSNGVDQASSSCYPRDTGTCLPSEAPATHRILLMATPRFPLKAKLVISDRDREELNFSRGELNWRYRNRLQAEREITIHSYHPVPYADIEAYYDSKFQKWSSIVIEAGSQFPIRKHTELDIYYEHQNNTGKAPNEQVNAAGLMLNLHF